MSAYRERRFLSRDGLSLYWRDYGDPLAAATPIVCLSGLTRNSNDFHDFALRYCGTRRILCPDYRGRGRSDYDRNWRNYHPATYLDDLRSMLAVAGIHRAVVVGTSLGGILAMALSAAMPGLLAGVVLNDVGPDVSPYGLGRIIEYIGTDRPQPDWPSAMVHLKELFPTLTCEDDEHWLKVAQGTWRENPTDGMLHFDWDVRLARPLKQLSGPLPDLWQFFHGLRDIPTIALRGEVSDLLSPATFDRMLEAKPDLMRVVVPRSGHAPMLNEAPVLECLDDFLSRY